jgi:hypothetical protein
MNRGLKNSSETISGLWPGIRCFARKFAEAISSQIWIEATPQLRVRDPLVVEFFQPLNKELSNLCG